MTQELATPHDAFFKAVLNNLARSRQFFSSYLSEQLVRELDLEALQLEKGCFDGSLASAPFLFKASGSLPGFGDSSSGVGILPD
jgi:hypothetical protein